MPEHWLLYTIYLLVTFLYGSVFTLLFLGVDFHERKHCISFAVFSVAILGIQLALGYFATFDLVVATYPLVVHLPLFLFSIFHHKNSPLTAFSSITMAYFLTAPRTVLGELVSFLVPILPCPDISGKIVASFLLAFPIYHWAVPILQKSFRRSSKDVMHFFVPLTMVYFASYLLYVYTSLLSTHPVLMMELVFTFFLFIILLYLQEYFVSIDEMIEKENRNHILELSTDSMKKQLAILTESQEQTRILRHDIRHYASMAEQYATMGDFNKIIEITRKINEQNESVSVKRFCSNQSVNLLLSNYLAPLSDTDMNLQILVPEDSFIQDMDLCVLIGNTLDNAVRSIQNCRKQKSLSLILQCNEEKLYMELKNSCEGTVSFHDGLPLSTRQGHGYGSKSIRYLAEKYHGIYSFELSGDMFITKVILHN